MPEPRATPPSEGLRPWRIGTPKRPNRELLRASPESRVERSADSWVAERLKAQRRARARPLKRRVRRGWDEEPRHAWTKRPCRDVVQWGARIRRKRLRQKGLACRAQEPRPALASVRRSTMLILATVWVVHGLARGASREAPNCLQLNGAEGVRCSGGLRIVVRLVSLTRASRICFCAGTHF